MRGLLINLDLVDDAPFHQSFHRPDQMGKVYSIHGGAIADSFIEKDDSLIRVVVG